MTSAVPAPLSVRLVEVTDYPTGVLLAEAAKRATGFPLDATVEDVGARFAARQKRALGVWLAFLDDEPVGHALVEPIRDNHPSWDHIADRAVASARTRGALVEFGGLVVAPEHHGRGIATALVEARMDWASRHDLLGCASVWDDSVGSRRIAQRHGRHVGVHPALPIGLYIYDR